MALLATLNVQANGGSCLPQWRLTPVIIKNDEDRVTFRCADASPLDLIRAVGFQTRLPIGIVLGADDGILSTPGHSYNLKHVEAKVAIAEALRHSDYSMKVEEGVIVLTPAHLTSSKQSVLKQPVHDFGPFASVRMADLESALNHALASRTDETGGSISSIPGPSSEQQYPFRVPDDASVITIANRIVSVGSKGLWCLTVAPIEGANTFKLNFEITAYEHYTNNAPSADEPVAPIGFK